MNGKENKTLTTVYSSTKTYDITKDEFKPKKRTYEVNKIVSKTRTTDEKIDPKSTSYKRYFNQSRNMQRFRRKKLNESINSPMTDRNDEKDNFSSNYRKEMRDRYNKNYYSTYNIRVNDNEKEKPLTSRYSRHYRENTEDFDVENITLDNIVNKSNWDKLDVEKYSIELISKKIGDNDLQQKKK